MFAQRGKRDESQLLFESERDEAVRRREQRAGEELAPLGIRVGLKFGDRALDQAEQSLEVALVPVRRAVADGKAMVEQRLPLLAV